MNFIDILIFCIFFVSLFLSAMFSGLETAIISVNKVKLNHLAEEGNSKAKELALLIEKMELIISACLIGNNITIVSASVMIGTFLNIHNLTSEWISLTAVAMETAVFLFWGEIIPKALFRSRANSMALFFLPFIKTILFIFRPFLFVLNKLNQRLFRKSDGSKPYLITRKEMEHLFELGSLRGIIDNEGSGMISDVFEFGNITAREIMVPTIHIVSAEIKKSLAYAARLAKNHGYSRIPIHEERVDNLVGYVSVRAILNASREASIRQTMQKTMYVPFSKKISDLYVEMRSLRIAIAFVVNEYGAVAGMISQEDIVEEIVGEIQTLEHPREDLIVQLAEDSYLIDAMVNIDDINKIFHTDINKKGFQTIAGFVAYRFGRIPSQGMKISLDHHVFTVAEASPTVIKRVHLKIDTQHINVNWKGTTYAHNL